jgi:hypothetical protein
VQEGSRVGETLALQAGPVLVDVRVLVALFLMLNV